MPTATTEIAMTVAASSSARQLRQWAYETAMAYAHGQVTAKQIAARVRSLTPERAAYYLLNVVSFLPDHDEQSIRRSLSDIITYES